MRCGLMRATPLQLRLRLHTPRLSGWMDGRTDRRTDGRKCACMNACMGTDVCMEMDGVDAIPSAQPVTDGARCCHLSGSGERAGFRADCETKSRLIAAVSVTKFRRLSLCCRTPQATSQPQMTEGCCFCARGMQETVEGFRTHPRIADFRTVTREAIYTSDPPDHIQ